MDGRTSNFFDEVPFFKSEITGADPEFYHIVFFCRILVVLENPQVISGSGGAHPLHPPPRSAPGSVLTFASKPE